ncbi:MAG: MBL fold metallo-hydrolase RNA specificity domain-containing protein [Wenzhouxiangella sp.]
MSGGQKLTLAFHGAAGTVTGSRLVLSDGKRRCLIDCGLFQGYKPLRLRNWAHPGFDARALDAIVLTHAHLDHSGYLPVVCRDGYNGPIHCTAATRDLCRHLLADSGFIQEKDAARANRYGYTRHHPARPLYTQAEAVDCLTQFQTHPFHVPIKLYEHCSATFLRAGHIPGAASIALAWHNRRIVFSGDLGQSGSPTMMPPEPPPAADYLIVESTYGNRNRTGVEAEARMAEVIRETVARGGTVIIPAFAVGRTQLLLHHLSQLQGDGRIPRVPIFLDSPLAINATEVFVNHPDDHRLSKAEAEAACALPRYVRDADESRQLDHDPMPKIIIAGSGMATGGRVLHHLKVYLGDPRHTILFTGYQSGGTRGDKLVQGAPSVRIHGQDWPVRAAIENLDMLSAHADSDELMAWLRACPQPPRQVFIVHGEAESAEFLAYRISMELGWHAVVPKPDESFTLN